MNSHLQKQRENQRQQISTFVITDKSGNEIKVTPMDNLDVTVPGGETESNSIFEPSLIQNCTASEINTEICNDSRTSETSDREYDISDIDSRSDDEHVIPVTETDDTEINVTDQDMSNWNGMLLNHLSIFIHRKNGLLVIYLNNILNHSVQIQACSSRPLICLKTNCDVKRKYCGDIRLSL